MTNRPITAFVVFVAMLAATPLAAASSFALQAVRSLLIVHLGDQDA